MVLKKIFKGYLSIGVMLVQFLALLALCVLVAAIIVFPLWKLAVISPNLYSSVCALLIFGVLCFVLVPPLRQKYRKNPKLFIISLVRKAVLLGGLVVSVMLVLHFMRVYALLVFIVTLLAYGYLAFGLSIKDAKKN